ncbi:hypothetical protein CPC735_049090 [Coccidioides posadasii C735 delta SOWgp]|uniref:Uncharacterized protein n=1 Tax=Coccidioides posadasii (strain C735) TaxID=222929 RepID=C5PG86_COCP7|nr:hypothetical protein CPC735_049090 [Coccidioides posadasii C735 delta SOWgp]EER23539.1 hypothetical protein CPC735_049090 [Coccidioides posadasii C735 delta SOWgp]|eukprot:XP_003065684.1 hypothetical protein CPC735_049090 [Coccidioides posadasii C735 delta SOWgp]
MNSPFFSSTPLSGLNTPMSARPTPYTTAYNPQEWGPIAPVPSPTVGIGVITPGNTGTHRGHVNRTGWLTLLPKRRKSFHQPFTLISPLDAASPPPPYSPPRSQNLASSQSPHLAMSPQNNALSPPMAHQQEFSSMARASGSSSINQYSSPRPRPASMVNTGGLDGQNAPHSLYQSSIQGGGNVQLQLRPDTSTSNAFAGPSTHTNAHSSVISPGRISPDAYPESQAPRLVPPAARRAASTGDINPSSRLTLSHDGLAASRSGRWEPGMPLPPPPPGPPPGASPRVRQSSLEPPGPTMGAAPRNRPRPPSTGTALGSVPPTPAGWSADSSRPDSRITSPHNANQQPTLATGPENKQQSSSHVSLEAPGPARPTSGGNGRMASPRIATSKELRERRIESRSGREADNQGDTAGTEESHTSWPSDLVLGNSRGPGLVRRRTVTRATPRSARSLPSGGQDSGGFPNSPFSKRSSPSSSFSTPRALQASEPSHTPTFAPAIAPRSSTPLTEGGRKVPPNALHTPPTQEAKDPEAMTGLTPLVNDRGRPVSHLLHLPVDESPSDRPLVPIRAVNPIFTPPLSGRRDETFLRNAESRYREFIEKEIDAHNDSEALDIFCDFIISESRIRRQRYASVWKNGSFNVKNIEEQLFTPQTHSDDETTVPQLPPLSTGRREPGLWNNYKPALSTIASMSISNDEQGSRGRPASRWWESQTGSDSGGNGQGVRRSKRESKYMGLPLREVMEQNYCTSPIVDNSTGYTNNPFLSYGPNEYPPEKVGWHEDSAGAQGPIRQLSLSREAQKLDISRLITLPPPYPRHYPGVNNNHPDLGFYRTTVRSVTELSELREAYQNHETKFQKLREDHQRKVKEERQDFRFRVNQAIEEGTISYADAADAEAGRKAKENEAEKKLAQKEFDSYQEEVLRPMQSVLKDRIGAVSACLNELQEKLFDSTNDESPNQTQEEGDERPELLEKLTQLKWLFEAREQLHREEYDLLSKCNEKFRAVVSLPYKQSNNREKLKETDNFFIQDGQNREATFASETLQRFENFMSVIEANVSRGVETQLGAFWDIAPSLLALVQKIPDDLGGFSVKIPQKEYKENPSYYQYPLQYLYTLVSHAEKATYQFIESQTNLLCLLHEVKSGLVSSNCKSMEIQRINSGEPAEIVTSEMQESLAEEERILTADLKEKVGMVEGQWHEALGSQLENVKGRVQKWLEEEGGWEGILQMEEA